MTKLRLRVKEVATEKKMSMSVLSHRSYAALSTIRAIYREPFRPVSTDTLMRLADALEVSIHDLIEEVPDDVARAEMEAIKKGPQSLSGNLPKPL